MLMIGKQPIQWERFVVGGVIIINDVNRCPHQQLLRSYKTRREQEEDWTET